MHLCDLSDQIRSSLYHGPVTDPLTLSQTNPGFYVSAVQVFCKHCEKRRNCLLGAISPFSPKVFSMGFENFLVLS